MLPQTADRKINVLVCSGNLGNQEPDQESLDAWIPFDGQLQEVIDNQRYPVQLGTPYVVEEVKSGTREGVMKKTKAVRKSPSENKIGESDNNECFDIIAIGMQEATFEVETSEAIFAAIAPVNILATQAQKAHKVVAGLTRSKDHLRSRWTDAESPSARSLKKSVRRLLRPLTFIRQRSQEDDSDPSSSLHRKESSVRPSTWNLSGRDDAFRSRQKHSSIHADNNEAPTQSTGSNPPTSTSSALQVSRNSGPNISTESAPRISTDSVPPLSTGSALRIISTGFDLDGSRRSYADTGFENSLTSDTRVLHAMLQAQLPNFKHAVSYQRGQMRLMIFHREDDMSVEVLSVKAQNTGKGGLANKGGIVAEILVNNTTRLSFFTAHLEAHEGISKYEMRCSSVVDIFRGTVSSRTTTCSKCDATLSSHFTFAMGDLNFRTRYPGHEPRSSEHITATNILVEEKDWERLYSYDELTEALRNNDCFSGFSTAKCLFPPTFKVDRRQGYVYNPKRSPSYTDRILFASGHCLRNCLKVLAYEPIDDFASSDHKPIRGAFEVTLNPRIKMRPTIVKSSAHGVKPESSDKREFLHMFVSSLAVQIDEPLYRKNRNEVRRPRFSVCFFSTPGEALKKDVRRWARVKSYAARLTGAKDKGGGDFGSASAWPETRKRKPGFNIRWSEMVHFKVRTHDPNGIPIDLSGAIIHVAVLDGDSESIVGIFPLNLAHLLTYSRKGSALKRTTRNSVVEPSKPVSRLSVMSNFVGNGLRRGKETNEYDRPDFIRTSSSGISFRSRFLSGGRNRSKDSFGSDLSPGKIRNSASSGRFGFDDSKELDESVYTDIDEHLITSGPSAQMAGTLDSRRWHRLSRTLRRSSSLRQMSQKFSQSSLDAMEVFSMNINHSLRKYGIKVGQIQFTVDSFWLSDEAAERRARRENSEELSTGYD